MSLFLGENQHFYKKNQYFCNQTGKVFKVYSFYLSYFKFDAALFNLHISCRVYLKTCLFFSYFASKTDIFTFRCILGNACFAIS